MSTPCPCESQSYRSFAIDSTADAARAVRETRRFLTELGFDAVGAVLTATAASELAMNIANHASRGWLTLRAIEADGRRGCELLAEDEGPGIPDFALACTEGYSTAGSLGLGLPGVCRIMDEVEFDSARRVGTSIRARKWR